MRKGNASRRAREITSKAGNRTYLGLKPAAQHVALFSAPEATVASNRSNSLKMVTARKAELSACSSEEKQLQLKASVLGSGL